MSKTRRIASRGKCEVCTLLITVRMSTGLTAATRTLGGHLANTQTFTDYLVANVGVFFRFKTDFQFAFQLVWHSI